MRCKHVKSNLISFIKNELSERIAKNIDIHIKKCPVCQKEKEQISLVLEKLEKVQIAKPSPESAQKFRIKFDELLEKEKKLPFWLRIPEWVTDGAVMAAISLIITIVIIRFFPINQLKTQIMQNPYQLTYRYEFQNGLNNTYFLSKN